MEEDFVVTLTISPELAAGLVVDVSLITLAAGLVVDLSLELSLFSDETLVTVADDSRLLYVIEGWLTVVVVVVILAVLLSLEVTVVEVNDPVTSDTSLEVVVIVVVVGAEKPVVVIVIVVKVGEVKEFTAGEVFMTSTSTLLLPVETEPSGGGFIGLPFDCLNCTFS